MVEAEDPRGILTWESPDELIEADQASRRYGAKRRERVNASLRPVSCISKIPRRLLVSEAKATGTVAMPVGGHQY